MSEFYPYFTKDGSVGLYSKDFNDIYHSATGALTEAYEKFIFPSNLHDILLRYDNIKVLDICYGIGYNTKALLNYILENRKNISSQKNFQNKITNKFGIICASLKFGIRNSECGIIYAALNRNYVVDGFPVPDFLPKSVDKKGRYRDKPL